MEMSIQQVLASWALDNVNEVRAQILYLRETPHGITFLDLLLSRANVERIPDNTLLTMLTCTAVICRQLSARRGFYFRALNKVADKRSLEGLECPEGE